MAVSWNLTDLANVPKNGIKVMSTFSCGGGSSMGYKLAGCEVIAVNDIDAEMMRHYQANLHPRLSYLCSISDLITAELPPELFSLDILDGSPPCSTFSMSGNREADWGKDKHFREGQSKQVLSDLFFEYLDLVERLKPKVVIAENVKGLILGNAKGYLRMIFTRLRGLGYRPQAFLLNAANCGVPQRRERVFICAVRNDVSDARLTIDPKQPWVSAGVACASVTNLTTNELKATTLPPSIRTRWPLTLRGESFDKATFKLTGKKSYFSWIRLHKHTTAPTLTAHYLNFTHWDECRSLCCREWKVLGSFPNDYKVESEDLGRYLIGMSVPPKMAEVVARAVCSQWLGVQY